MPNAQSSLLLLLPLLLSHRSSTASISPPPSPDPMPAPWPEQFHSVLLSNNSGALSLIDLWYDWPNGRNFNIIRNQLARPPVHDLEWNNGTSFIYTLPDAPSPSCRTLHFPVGILRPNWLDGAAYLGHASVDGFLCNIWEKADFIRYYEDAATRRPVHWIFYTGMAEHVMTFDVGAVLGDKEWQAPAYCFGNGAAEEAGDTSAYEGLEDMALRRSLRALASVPSMAEGVAQ